MYDCKVWTLMQPANVADTADADAAAMGDG